MKHLQATPSPFDRAAGLLRLLLLTVLILAPAMVQAAPPRTVASDVYIERQDYRADGTRKVRLEPAAEVHSGDSLLFRVDYRPTGEDAAIGASQKWLTSAVPDGVSFLGGGDIVSVDGGRHWGRLDRLTVRGRDGAMRRALPGDVTHVRWVVGTRGDTRASLLFRGRAR